MHCHKIVFFIFLLSLNCRTNRLFSPRDFTPVNSFTENCEGPAVDKSGQLFVVNYQKDGTVGHFQPDGRGEVFVELPAGSTANAIRFDSRGDLLLADFSGHNVLKINAKTRAVTTFCHDARFHQPNDLCMAQNDVLYASDPDWKNGTGQLWRIEADGKVVLMESGMGTTNGIELSPDERTLYVNESIQRNVWAYDRLPDGGLRNKRLFVHFDEHGLDGMKCDREGNLYITRWGAGRVAVYSPAGKMLREIRTKGARTSNLTFGGPDGRTVFVTLQDRKCVETFRNDIPGKGY